MPAASISLLHYASPPLPRRGLDPAAAPPTTTKTPAHQHDPTIHLLRRGLPSPPVRPALSSGAPSYIDPASSAQTPSTTSVDVVVSIPAVLARFVCWGSELCKKCTVVRVARSSQK
ncbi:hypothetical protein VPH35_078035 [Triticum aestivum]